MRPRIQFSIRTMIAATLLCALAICGWRTFIYEPPTHRFSSYEKATGYHGTSAKIGPNRIEILSVARNDRDGKISIQDGRGKSIVKSILEQPVLAACSDWLDVAQIELSPGIDRTEILEVRVFDHSTREYLNQVDRSYGWRFFDSESRDTNVIQIYGLGKRLPEKVDLWIRLHSYEANAPVQKLAPTIGSSIHLAQGTLTIEDAQNGYAGWSSRDGFVPVDGEHHAECVFEITGSERQSGGNGTALVGPYQIAAVLKDGRRRFHEGAWRSTSHPWMHEFPSPLKQIDHLEVQPHGGRHRFFFDGLQLPSTSSAKFGQPPKAIVKVGGAEVARTVLSEFAPLEVVASVRDGNPFSGSTGGGSGGMVLTPRPSGPTSVGEEWMIAIESRGFHGGDWSHRILPTTGKRWLGKGMVLSRGSHRVASNAGMIQSNLYRMPLVELDQVEIQISP